MITLTRREARRLRAVFRRHALGITTRGPVPPLVLQSDGAGVRARYRYGCLALEHGGAAASRACETVALPLDALSDVEGRDDSPVSLEAAAPGTTIARWQDRGMPRSREYAVPEADPLAGFPGPPWAWAEAPAGLLDALAEATATGTDDGTRYALDCILLRGSTGEVVATDGRQLLVAGGFSFPWPGDVLVGRSPLFAGKELPRDRPVSVGKTDTHVVLRAGPWTLFLEVQSARFPRVDQVIPDPGAVVARLSLDAGDAAFLAGALDRLPGADERDSPATLDLNGEVAIRARAADPPGATELVLSRSHYTGTPIRVRANREFFARAVRLGFRELEVSGAESPAVFRDGARAYCFQPLSQESAPGPSHDVVRIESPPSPTRPAPAPGVHPDGDLPVARKPNPPDTPSRVDGGAGTAPAPAESPGAGGLAALIREAEALHEALSETKARAGRLTAALRRYRRRERLVSSTLASLRALNLREVAE